MAKKKEKASIYEIIQGLAQAAANAYDGALNEDGDALKVGLQREEGHLILDKRVIDGFNVKFYGDMMCLTYQSEVQLKEVYASGFENEVDHKLNEIAKWLKKEYRKVTGKSVKLTEDGEVDVLVQSASRVHSWVQAKKHYRVGGLAEEMNNSDGSRAPLERSWKSFLDQGGWKGKRPKNDSRPKNSGD